MTANRGMKRVPAKLLGRPDRPDPRLLVGSTWWKARLGRMPPKRPTGVGLVVHYDGPICVSMTPRQARMLAAELRRAAREVEGK